MRHSCEECHWFSHSIVYGRNTKLTCRDLGEKPEHDACHQFEFNFEPEEFIPDEYHLARREAIKRLPVFSPAGTPRGAKTPLERTKERLDVHVTASHRQMVKEIIADQYMLEQGALIAIYDLKEWLRQQGSSVEFEGDRRFLSFFNDLADLRLLHALIHALGLAEYAQEILGYEIANKFHRSPKLKREVKESARGDKILAALEEIRDHGKPR